MSVFYFVAAFLLIIRLRKLLKFSPLMAKWSLLLNYGYWGVGILYVVLQKLSNVRDGLDGMDGLAGVLVLLGLIYYLKKEEDFKPFDTLLMCLLHLTAK
jgi:two-component system NtrC family sensor kinase